MNTELLNIHYRGKQFFLDFHIMKVILRFLLIFLVIQVIIEKTKTDFLTSEASKRVKIPPVEQLGGITKWMSDPPPKSSVKPTLTDSFENFNFNARSMIQNGLHLESWRVEDRVNTLAYSPNIDHLRALNCFALNFGWPVEITLPSISVSLNSKNTVDFKVIRKTAPSNCFIVMVGGRFISRMDLIVRKVDEITSQLPIKMVAYFGEKTDVVPKKDLEKLPAIVSILK